MARDGGIADDDLDIAIGTLSALCRTPERARVATLFNDIDLVGAAWIVSRRLVLSSEVATKDETCPMLRFAAVLTLTVAVAGSALAQTRDANSVVPWRIQDSGAAKSAESERKGFTPSPVWRIQRDDEPKRPAAPATQRPSLGVSVLTVTQPQADLVGLQYQPGAWVAGLLPGSGAEAAGLQIEDLIVKVDDHDVSSSDQLVRLITMRNVGAEVTIHFIRNGRRSNARAVLSAADDQSAAALLHADGRRKQDQRTSPAEIQAAVRMFRSAAESGYVPSMAHLGWMYLEGRDVERDYVLALRWLEAAARQGDMSANSNICLMRMKGYGGKRNYSQARGHCERAAIGANVAAYTNLGWLLANGHGGPTDRSRAHRLYAKAAELGDATAMNNLGVAYLDGDGVAKNLTIARRWFEKAKAAGSDYALQNLSNLDAYEARRGRNSSRSGSASSNGSGSRNCRPVADQCQQCGSNPGVGNNCYWVACNHRYVCD